ncbi:hypothetical protein [Kitasatospora aureofaciens]|nr:hypothetical protein [Kitasatospora aureofaciens]
MVDAVRALRDYSGPHFPDDIPAHLTRAAHELLVRIPPPSTPS